MTTKYVPPSMRKQVVPQEVFDASNKIAFPSLGSNTVEVKKWGVKTSFKKTIDNLIAYEKLTEQEKRAEAELAKTMEGWSILPLEMTTERMIELHNRNMEREVELRKAYEDGGFYIYIPEMEIPPQTGKAEVSDDETSEEETDYVTEE